MEMPTAIPGRWVDEELHLRCFLNQIQLLTDGWLSVSRLVSS